MNYSERGTGSAFQAISAAANRRANNFGGPERELGYELDKTAGAETSLGNLAMGAELTRTALEQKYWPVARAKGIERGKEYEIKGVKFVVSGLELTKFGGKERCNVVLHDSVKGNKREVINLDDSFWEVKQ